MASMGYMTKIDVDLATAAAAKCLRASKTVLVNICKGPSLGTDVVVFVFFPAVIIEPSPPRQEAK
jgi:hypothetical protein